MKVLLWDIDGTLLNTDRAGMYAWLQALEEENGGPLKSPEMNLAGQTDRSIARVCIESMLEREYSEELAQALLDRYVELLPEWLQRRDNGYVIAGVLEILEAAVDRDDVVLALLTGNVEAGGRLKLDRYGILDYFEWGAFADVAVGRRDIARFARRTAEQRYGADNLEALYVIGDTEHDIDCGKAIGARTIGVATGWTSAEVIQAHDPWWAVDRLPPPGKFFSKLEQP